MLTEKGRKHLESLLCQWGRILPDKFDSIHYILPVDLETNFRFVQTSLGYIDSMCLGGWLCWLIFDGEKSKYISVDSYLLSEVCGNNRDTAKWLFSSRWSNNLDHTKSRVEYLLKHGIPPESFNYGWQPEQKKDNMNFIKFNKKTKRNMVRGGDIKAGDVYQLSNGERWVALENGGKSRMCLDKLQVIGDAETLGQNGYEYNVIGKAELVVTTEE